MKSLAYAMTAAFCLAGASAASAGTSTDTGTASMNVINQCTITGGNVSLGTYRTTDTLQTVANQLGYQDAETYDFVAGTNGIGTMLMGSVTCDAGTPYTIMMQGAGPVSGIEIQIPAGTILLYTTVKKVGDSVVPDGDSYLNGFGKESNPDTSPSYSDQSPVGTIANGAAQPIMGNIVLWRTATTSNGLLGADAQLGAAGVYTGSWINTLNF